MLQSLHAPDVVIVIFYDLQATLCLVATLFYRSGAVQLLPVTNGSILPEYDRICMLKENCISLDCPANHDTLEGSGTIWLPHMFKNFLERREPSIYHK